MFTTVARIGFTNAVHLHDVKEIFHFLCISHIFDDESFCQNVRIQR